LEFISNASNIFVEVPLKFNLVLGQTKKEISMAIYRILKILGRVGVDKFKTISSKEKS
jgi:hypothetical protein